MVALHKAGSFKLGDRHVYRMGYGAMQLAGKHVFGPPRDHAEAIAVLREAVEAGVDHIDTSDFYGPFITNQIIREALHPYPDNLVIVTKIGARRDDKGAWLPALSPGEIVQAVDSNLRNLGLDALEVVNFRAMFAPNGPREGSIEAPFAVLCDLQRQGKIKHLGVSNVTPAQLAQARGMGKIVCVQNLYNLAQRQDEAMLRALAQDGIAYVPFFPLGGFTRLQSAALDEVAGQVGATPMQVALAWLLQRAPNVLLIPGTSSRAHLRENLAAAELELPPAAVAKLDAMAG
jgi:aryl-alcohol dehydrogenase-like predicted oxidoreductase